MNAPRDVSPQDGPSDALVAGILRWRGYEWRADGAAPALVRTLPIFLWTHETAAVTAVVSAAAYFGAATLGSLWVVIATMWTLAVFVAATRRLADEAPLRGAPSSRRTVVFTGAAHTYREGGASEALVDGRPFGPVTSVRVVSTKLDASGGEAVSGTRFEVLLVTPVRAVCVFRYTHPRFDDDSDRRATTGIRSLAHRIARATGGIPVDEAEGSESDAYDRGLWGLAALGFILNCVAVQAHAALERRAGVAACVLALILACRLFRRAKGASVAAEYARRVYGIINPKIPPAWLSPSVANALIAALYMCLAASAIWSTWR